MNCWVKGCKNESLKFGDIVASIYCETHKGMHMTKKDYVKLAGLFTGLKRYESQPLMVANCIIARISKMLAEDNLNFDREKFAIACRKEYER